MQKCVEYIRLTILKFNDNADLCFIYQFQRSALKTEAILENIKLVNFKTEKQTNKNLLLLKLNLNR